MIMETILNRLDKYMAAKGIKDRQLEVRCGISNGLLNNLRKKNGELGPKSIERILKTYTDINTDWFIKGIGEMLLSESPPIEPPPESGDTILIPFASPDFIGGTRFNEEVNTEEYINGYLPFPTSIAHQGDLVVPIYGDSMEPTYKSGSMVLIREVELWREYLELGCAYVIGLVDDRRVIKTVMAGSDADHFLLVSINPAYQPQEIAKDIIRSVWRVIVSVRREAI